MCMCEKEGRGGEVTCIHQRILLNIFISYFNCFIDTTQLPFTFQMPQTCVVWFFFLHFFYDEYGEKFFLSRRWALQVKSSESEIERKWNQTVFFCYSLYLSVKRACVVYNVYAFGITPAVGVKKNLS